MSVLYAIASIRNPVFDVFFSLVTRFGEEVIYLAVALFFIWCVDKFEGYYILSVGFLGVIVNQFLKIVCRVPRPWVKDPSFSVVEGTKEAATGYSFPSGHTQTAVGTFGGIAYWHRKKVIVIPCLVLCVLVAFSRLYLGVHSFADVSFSLLMAGVLFFTLEPLFRYFQKNPSRFYWFIGGMGVLSLAFVLFMELYPFAPDIDAENLKSAFKNAYTILGAVLGFGLVYWLDQAYIHYETKAIWWAQLIKLAVGLGLIIALRIVLKAPCNAITGGHASANAIRYFLIVLFAGALYPLTFPFFAKLGKKREKEEIKEETHV